MEVTEFHSDVDRFISSVVKIRKLVGFELLNKQKRFRLTKIQTKLRKEKSTKIKWVKHKRCCFFSGLVSLLFLLFLTESFTIDRLNISGGRDRDEMS